MYLDGWWLDEIRMLCSKSIIISFSCSEFEFEFYDLYQAREIGGSSSGVYSPAVNGN